MNGRGRVLAIAMSVALPGVCSGISPAQATSKPTYAHKMEVGQLLYFNGDIERAIHAFEAAAELNPKAYEPHLNLINLYVQKGGDDALLKAMQECREVISRKPANKEAHLILGNLLRTKAGQEMNPEAAKQTLEEARKEVATAEELGASKALCEYTIGTLLLQQGDFDESLKHINEAVDKQPVFPDAHLIRAVLLFKNLSKNLPKNADGAPKPLDPNEPATKKQIDEIISALNMAIKQKPKNVEAHNTKAEIEMTIGNLDDSLKEYKQSTEDDPKNAQAWVGVGTIEATIAMKETDQDKQRAHFENAAAAFEKALDVRPEDKTVITALAAMDIRLGRNADAVRMLERQLMLETDPLAKAQLSLQIQQLQGGIGGVGSALMAPQPPVGVGNSLFTSGALSMPFKDLIKIKAPKGEKSDE